MVIAFVLSDSTTGERRCSWGGISLCMCCQEGHLS
ncbi:hypothetical protein Gorai_006381, partial [Gossypium raimondii]|nr:hypothetical protein [Gossypium raimondii]